MIIDNNFHVKTATQRTVYSEVYVVTRGANVQARFYARALEGEPAKSGQDKLTMSMNTQEARALAIRLLQECEVVDSVNARKVATT